MKSGTKILPCTCSNKYQDAKWGKGNRVHNLGKEKAPNEPSYICTVCGIRK